MLKQFVCKYPSNYIANIQCRMQGGTDDISWSIAKSWFFLPWETMCPMKEGGGGKPLRQSGWRTSGRMNHVYPPLSPHLSWRSRSQDQGSGVPQCSQRQVFTMNPKVQNRSNHGDIFQSWFSARLDSCFEHTIIPRICTYDKDGEADKLQ